MQVYSYINENIENSLGISIGLTRQSETIQSFLGFYLTFIGEALSSEGAEDDTRFQVIKEVLLTLNPFPHCSWSGCHCFGRSLRHKYFQEVS